MEQNNMNRGPKLDAVLRSEHSDFPSDVLGSYTGLTADGERPVQDADDL